MNERQAPWTVQLPLVVVFVAGVATVALGVRQKGQDDHLQGVVQMALGALMCVLATMVKNGSRDARSVLVVTLSGAAVLSIFLSDVSEARRLIAFGLGAFVIAMVTIPARSRVWFGDLEPAPESEDAFDE